MKYKLSILFAAIALAGCSGGGDSAPTTPVDGKTLSGKIIMPENVGTRSISAMSFSTQSVSTRAVDKSAFVWIDINGSGSHESWEPSTTTIVSGEDGSYDITFDAKWDTCIEYSAVKVDVDGVILSNPPSSSLTERIVTPFTSVIWDSVAGDLSESVEEAYLKEGCDHIRQNDELITRINDQIGQMEFETEYWYNMSVDDLYGDYRNAQIQTQSRSLSARSTAEPSMIAGRIMEGYQKSAVDVANNHTLIDQGIVDREFHSIIYTGDGYSDDYQGRSHHEYLNGTKQILEGTYEGLNSSLTVTRERVIATDGVGYQYEALESQPGVFEEFCTIEYERSKVLDTTTGKDFISYVEKYTNRAPVESDSDIMNDVYRCDATYSGDIDIAELRYSEDGDWMHADFLEPAFPISYTIDDIRTEVRTTWNYTAEPNCSIENSWDYSCSNGEVSKTFYIQQNAGTGKWEWTKFTTTPTDAYYNVLSVYDTDPRL